MNYTPRPIDTSEITLPAELTELAEVLARNIHEIWAGRRRAEGWTYGGQRNDITREHPCLVPFPQLPEIEQGYDREAALQTIKAIISLGYRIEKP